MVCVYTRNDKVDDTPGLVDDLDSGINQLLRRESEDGVSFSETPSKESCVANACLSFCFKCSSVETSCG